MTNDQPLSAEASKNMLESVMKIWIAPEIEKRKQAGYLKNDFRLKAFQIVFFPPGRGNRVKLNKEVKAIAECKVKSPKKSGDLVLDTDIDGISSIKLPDKYPDCAHITGLFLNGSWHVCHDSVYNKKSSDEHVQAATEFLESAKDNLSKKRLRPFFEDAFACAELLTTAILLPHLVDKRGHDTRIRSLEEWTELGNVPEKYVKMLKRLYGIRPSSRYLASTSYKSEHPEDYLQELEDMMNYVKGQQQRMRR